MKKISGSGSDDFFEESSDYSSDYIFGKSSGSGSDYKKKCSEQNSGWKKPVFSKMVFR